MSAHVSSDFIFVIPTYHHGPMERVAIILPSETYRAKAFVEAARDLGVQLTVVSEKRQLLLSEAEFLQIDLASPMQAAADIVERHTATPFAAIIPVDDQGVLVAAYAAHDLGLAHNHPAAVATTREKAMLRRALRDKVPQPPFVVVERSADAAEVAAGLKMPLVIKPLSLAASQGVIRVDTPHEAPAAVARIRRILACSDRNPNEPLLFERFVPGDEVAVEGVLVKGALKILAVLDKPDPLDGPYFEESIYVTPSRHHPEILAEVARVTQLAIDAIGLTEGPVHAELRIDGSFVRLIELAARPIGGLCGEALQFGLLGTSLETMLLPRRPWHAHPRDPAVSPFVWRHDASNTDQRNLPGGVGWRPGPCRRWHHKTDGQRPGGRAGRIVARRQPLPRLLVRDGPDPRRS